MEKRNTIQLNTVENTIKHRIFIIRDRKVMLDSDLAQLYQIDTGRLNEQVKRNLLRFPGDFMFQLHEEEYENLRSQFATSSSAYGGRRYLPFAFTEQGIAMLSSVLNSEIAIQMNIFIVRAFIKMRESLETYKDLAMKIDKIEIAQLHDHAALRNVHSVVKQLLEKPSSKKKAKKQTPLQ